MKQFNLFALPHKIAKINNLMKLKNQELRIKLRIL